MITEPHLPADCHPALAAATRAASQAWQAALAGNGGAAGREALLAAVDVGADGTPTSRLDQIVESAVVSALDPFGVNILSEEIGHVDRGSSVTLVIDPVDGTGNAAAGIPFSAFTGAVAIDGRFVEGLTLWFDTGRSWWAHVERPTALRTSGRQNLDGAIVSMIRPKEGAEGFLAVCERADRVRVLGSSSLESALVAQGALDAFLDAGSDTHRIVDLAAAVVLVGQAGGVVTDVGGRPVEFTLDIAGRWSGVVAASRELADELLELLV